MEGLVPLFSGFMEAAAVGKPAAEAGYQMMGNHK